MANSIPRELMKQKEVRDLVRRNHVPEEMWTWGGGFAGLHCDKCGHSWPCPTRQVLDGMAPWEGRSR